MTYLLGLAVAIVWGIIIYRVVDAAGGSDDDHTPVAVAHGPKEAYDDYAVLKDTSHLLLNYRDPFGLVKQKDTTSIPVKKDYPRKVAIAMPQPAFNWGFIQYSGYIRNPDSKKIITLMSINGKSEMLAEGENRGVVKLIKNLRDSIKISFNGKTKFIAIRPAAL